VKIVYFHQYFNTPLMGGSTRSYEFSKRLVNAGHEVDIITTDREPEKESIHTWRTSIEDGVRVHWYALPYSNKLSYSSRILVFVRFAIACSIRAFKIKADLVFASSTPLTIVLPGLLCSGFGRYRPFVFEVRDLWPEMPIAMGALKNPFLKLLARLLERVAYRCSESIVALSPGMRDGIIRAGADPDRVGIVPNSSDIDFFDSANDRSSLFPYEWSGQPVIIYTGTVGKVNGIKYLVLLAKELEIIESNVRILVVGDGVELDEVKQIAFDLDVEDSIIKFRPSTDKYEVASLYKLCAMGSNIVIDLPEARANSANKFFDTLAARRPVLVNHGGWMHDIVSKTGCGISTWNMPLKQAALVLHSHLNDEGWKISAEAKATDLALKHFDRNKLFNNLHALLEAAHKRSGNASSELATVDIDYNKQ
jgi:glycosyltransferase involved in cell wall biosynthesis